MRPIDIIRQGIDNDLLKYQNFTLCDITDSKIVRGIGLMLKVTPVDIETSSVSDDSRGTLSTFYTAAVCINAARLFWERDIHNKYYALVVNIIKDSNINPVAFLVPKTYIDPFRDDLDEEDKDKLDQLKKDITMESD